VAFASFSLRSDRQSMEVFERDVALIDDNGRGVLRLNGHIRVPHARCSEESVARPMASSTAVAEAMTPTN
jgi:hypothetical protein